MYFLSWCPFKCAYFVLFFWLMMIGPQIESKLHIYIYIYIIWYFLLHWIYFFSVWDQIQTLPLLLYPPTTPHTSLLRLDPSTIINLFICYQPFLALKIFRFVFFTHTKKKSRAIADFKGCIRSWEKLLIWCYSHVNLPAAAQKMIGWLTLKGGDMLHLKLWHAENFPSVLSGLFYFTILV